MIPSRRHFAVLTAALPFAWGLAGGARALARRPLVIAAGAGTPDHPEATRGAYELAIRDGADFIAARLFPTRDGALVARSDHELSASTDVATHGAFADRRRTAAVDGPARTGWFVEDFSLAELKTLTCTPASRRRAQAGMEVGRAILTFEELVTIARAGSVRTGRVIGLQAEMPFPTYFAGLDLALEPRLAGVIRVAGYNAPAAAMMVASADAEALKTIGELTRVRRVLRLAAASGDAPSPAGLAALRSRAEAVAVDAGLILDLTAPKTLPATPLVAAAHEAGLGVHAWTGGGFPPAPWRPADGRRLLAALFAAGVDAVSGDLAAPIARARSDVLPEKQG